MPSPVMGRMPIEKDVAAVRGIAMSGPMARYMSVRMMSEKRGEIL